MMLSWTTVDVQAIVSSMHLTGVCSERKYAGPDQEAMHTSVKAMTRVQAMQLPKTVILTVGAKVQSRGHAAVDIKDLFFRVYPQS